MKDELCKCSHVKEAHNAEGHSGSKNACERCYCNKYKRSGVSLKEFLKRVRL